MFFPWPSVLSHQVSQSQNCHPRDVVVLYFPSLLLNVAVQLVLNASVLHTPSPPNPAKQCCHSSIRFSLQMHFSFSVFPFIKQRRTQFTFYCLRYLIKLGVGRIKFKFVLLRKIFQNLWCAAETQEQAYLMGNEMVLMADTSVKLMNPVSCWHRHLL